MALRISKTWMTENFHQHLIKYKFSAYFGPRHACEVAGYTPLSLKLAEIISQRSTATVCMYLQERFITELTQQQLFTSNVFLQLWYYLPLFLSKTHLKTCLSPDTPTITLSHRRTGAKYVELFLKGSFTYTHHHQMSTGNHVPIILLICNYSIAARVCVCVCVCVCV